MLICTHIKTTFSKVQIIESSSYISLMNELMNDGAREYGGGSIICIDDFTLHKLCLEKTIRTRKSQMHTTPPSSNQCLAGTRASGRCAFQNIPCPSAAAARGVLYHRQQSRRECRADDACRCMCVSSGQVQVIFGVLQECDNDHVLIICCYALLVVRMLL